MRTLVSTQLDESTANSLNQFCANAHVSKAEVLRGLVEALVVDGKQFIFKEWRQQVSPLALCNREELVMDAMRKFECEVRARRLVAMLNGKVSRASVYRALDGLVAAGKVEKLDVSVKDWTAKKPYSVYRVKEQVSK